MRYAVYFVPEPRTHLGGFGTGVLGYDSDSGREISHPPLVGVGSAEIEQWTAEPRNYGFHATLKAPFRLSPSASEADLLGVAHAFAAQHRAIRVPRLTVTLLESFIALVPAERCPLLDKVAGDAVRAFDHLRSPLTAADRERRLGAGLTPRQTNLLDTWGYPHVFDEFRFHMTLTGRLGLDDGHRALAALTRAYAHVDEPVVISAITISRQPAPEARFRTLARVPLSS